MGPVNDPQINDTPANSQGINQGLKETPTLAMINYGTGKYLKVINGRVVTIPDTADSHDSYRVVDAGEADQTLNAILNGSSAEAIPSSDGTAIPMPRWRITPKEDNSDAFHIADSQSGTQLKDAGPRTEIAAISTDAFPRGPEHDSIQLWQLVALVADSLTSVDQTINFARQAMELLLEQWEDKKIVYTPKKPVATVASINTHDIKTLKDRGCKMKAKEEKALLDGGVRIDRQGFFQKKGVKDSPYFANLQGQVSKWSDWDKMKGSMNAEPPKELWLEA